MVKRQRTSEELEHELKLRDAEIESLSRQLTAFRDTLDALTWERRAIGVVAKTLCEQLKGHDDDNVPG